MNLDTRVTLKRISTLLCSIGTIVCYGYLLGGTGGYLVGRGRPLVALAGFASGSLLAFLAIKIWRSYLSDLERLEELERKAAEPGKTNEMDS